MASLLAIVFAFIEFDADAITWFFYALLLLCVVFPVSVAAVFTDQMNLGESNIEIRHNFRRSKIPRATIGDVTWAKGVGVVLSMKDGRTKILPDIGHNAQGASNSIRAWLRAGEDRP